MNRIIALSSLFLLVLPSCFFNDDARVIRPKPVCEEVENDPEQTLNESEVLECPACQCESPEFLCGEGEYLSAAGTCLDAVSLHDWLCTEDDPTTFDPCSVDVPSHRIIVSYGEVHDETAFLGWSYGSMRHDWQERDHDFTSQDNIVLTYDDFREMPPSMVLTNPSNVGGSISDDEVVAVPVETQTWIGAKFAFVVWMRYDAPGNDSEEEGTADVILGYEDSFSGNIEVVRGGKDTSVGSSWTCKWIEIEQTTDPGRLGELEERLVIYYGLVPAEGQLYVDSARLILMTP